MKTKQIPVIIALMAGLMTCILSFLNHVETGQFARNLCVVIVIFYILGLLIKFVVDKFFEAEKVEEESTEEETEGQQEEKEINETLVNEERRNEESEEE